MADYQSLANIARPQMMPEAPLGAGATAGWMYGGDQARQDQFIQQAAAQAQLKAQQDGLDAELRSAQQPGLMAGASLANLSNQDKLDLYKNGGKEVGQEEQEAKLEKLRKEMDFETLDRLATAEDEGAAAAILAKAKQTGGLRSRTGRDLADMPPAAAMKIAKTLTENTPKHRQDMAKEGLKQTNATERTKMIQAGQDRRAAILAKVRTEVAAANAAKAANKPLTMSQTEALAASEMYKDDPEGLLKYMLVKEAASRMPEAQARAGTAQGLGVPVQTPEAATPPTPNHKPKSKDAPTIPNLGAKHKGKKVVKREANNTGDAVRITYEDGTTEIIK